MSYLLRAQRERVGRRIKTARKTAGLSHDKLAAAVGSSRQHLIKLEKGDHLPGDGLLAKIADATGRDLSFFESESDDEEEPDPVADLFAALRRVVRDEVQAVNR